MNKNKSAEELKAAKKAAKSENHKKVFEFLEEELKAKKYTKRFTKYVKKLSDWLTEFEKKVYEGAKDNFQGIRHFEDQDDFGNTPLHIASLKGRVGCVELLLAAGISEESYYMIT